jgi:hypothetical protein
MAGKGSSSTWYCFAVKNIGLFPIPNSYQTAHFVPVWGAAPVPDRACVRVLQCPVECVCAAGVRYFL